jgi:hypothetical protein
VLRYNPGWSNEKKTTTLSRQFQNPIETTVTTEATLIPVTYI